MPSVVRWLDNNDDLNDTSNYSGGAVPGNDDTVLFLQGSQHINTNMAQFNANTGMTFIVGPDFAGKIGSSGNPLQAGTGSTLRFEGRRCKGSYWDLQTATEVVILDSNTGDSVLNLVAGTFTNVTVQRCGSMRIGGVTITNLFVEGSDIKDLIIEATAAITNVHQQGGFVKSFDDPANIYVNGGVWEHWSTSGGTVTLVETRGDGATFRIMGRDATFTAIKAFKGLVDHSQNQYPTTVTDSEVHFGGTLNFANGADTVVATNNPVVRGGVLIAGPSITPDVKVAASSGTPPFAGSS